MSNDLENIVGVICMFTIVIISIFRISKDGFNVDILLTLLLALNIIILNIKDGKLDNGD